MALWSCKKDAGSTCPTSLKLSLSNNSPAIGESFTITAPKETENNIFNWIGPGYSSSSNSNTLTLDDIKYWNRGWYYCLKSNSECNTTIRDSVFVDVKLKQGTPSCALTNNFFTSSNLVLDETFTSVTQGMDPTFNAMGVYGKGSYGEPTLRVLFNSYNGNTEPVDGIYTTTNMPTFDVTQQYNDVSVSFIYQGIYFHCRPDQDLYVVHVDGKIQVSFCNMVFSDGVSITTTCKGKMTEL